VRLVIQLAAHGQQVRETLAAHQLRAGVAEPVQQGGVDLGDTPVQQRREVSARRMLVQVLRAVLQERGELRQFCFVGLLTPRARAGCAGGPGIVGGGATVDLAHH
jgi:hypothetical protein